MRRRVLLLVSVVLLLAIIAVAIASQLSARHELDRVLRARNAADMHAAAAMVQRDAQNPAVAVARVDNFQTVLAANDGTIIAVNPPVLAHDQFRFFPDGLQVRHARGGEMVAIELHGNAYPITDANGQRIATAYFLPRPDPDPPPAIGRTLLLATIVAALAALLITAAMLRRVFAPIEALTAATQAIGRGERGLRVPIGGRDEVHELAASFNAMSDALERNEQARRQMVSDVAHELRTPLTNIRCAVEAAEDGIAPADLKSIGEDVAALARLVDDLQQLSLSDAGQLRLEISEMLLADAIASVVRAQANGVAISVAVDPSLRVHADPARLIQVLRNLLVNAIRHARTSVGISANATGRFVTVTVSDDGPGFPPDDLPRVFDRFYRADASRSRAGGGSGLGLAIARELVHLHGGTIAAANREGGGAVVSFTLPFITSSRPAATVSA